MRHEIETTAGLVPRNDRKVWVFCGDGEMDEPESTGALGLAGRERLDNLVFVVNCNLQRLDGPVRGNGKIIQELEGTFRGAGWNVIKLIWGSYWDKLLLRDTHGLLKQRMEEALDGFDQVSMGYMASKIFDPFPPSDDQAARDITCSDGPMCPSGGRTNIWSPPGKWGPMRPRRARSRPRKLPKSSPDEVNNSIPM